MKIVFLLSFLFLMASECPVSQNEHRRNIPNYSNMDLKEVEDVAKGFFNDGKINEIKEIYDQIKNDSSKEYVFRNDLLNHAVNEGKLEYFSQNLENMGFNATGMKYELKIGSGVDQKTIRSNYIEILAGSIAKDLSYNSYEQKITAFYENIKTLAQKRLGSIADVLDTIAKAFLRADKNSVDDLMNFFNKNVNDEVVAGILSLASNNQTDLQAIQKWLTTNMENEQSRKKKFNILTLSNIPITAEFLNNVYTNYVTDPKKLVYFYTRMNADEKKKLISSYSLHDNMVSKSISNENYEILSDLYGKILPNMNWSKEEKQKSLNFAKTLLTQNDRNLFAPHDIPEVIKKLITLIEDQLTKLQ